MHETLSDIQQKMNLIRAEIHKPIIGMDDVIDLILICLFAGRGSHAFLEGVPGVAKTELLKALAKSATLEFGRIQMTPDLLPHDITGGDFFKPGTNELEFRKGPIFTQFLLADELNRASPKTKSALLEAMQELQVTTESAGTLALPEPFMLFATQNPIEIEGTSPLAEAEKDRFLMNIFVSYPTRENEQDLVDLHLGDNHEEIKEVISGADIISMRNDIASHVHLEESLKMKAVDIVRLTRVGEPDSIFDKDELIKQGVSPRASFGLLRASRVLAVLEGRDYVTPHDVMNLSYPVLRHRIKFASQHLRLKTSEQLLREVLTKIFREVFPKDVRYE